MDTELSNAATPAPREIQVEVTGACNLRCQMCLVSYRPPLGRVSGSLCFDHYAAVIDALPDLEKVTLQGLGEPVLAPDLVRCIAYATAKGARVGFNTNGTLLTEAVSRRLIAAGLDWLHVSIDGASAESYEAIRRGGRFDTVVANLATLARVKRELGVPKPTVMVVFVAMRGNIAELPRLVRLVHGCGVDRLRVQNLSHSFSDCDPHGDYAAIRAFAADQAVWTDSGGPAEEPPEFAEARSVAAALGVDLRLPSFAAGDGQGVRRPDEPGCDWPWRSAYIAHDGRVQPCCMVMGSDRATLGDVTRQPFGEVWNGPAYTAFRKALMTDEPPAVCAGCAEYRRVF